MRKVINSKMKYLIYLTSFILLTCNISKNKCKSTNHKVKQKDKEKDLKNTVKKNKEKKKEILDPFYFIVDNAKAQKILMINEDSNLKKKLLEFDYKLDYYNYLKEKQPNDYDSYYGKSEINSIDFRIYDKIVINIIGNHKIYKGLTSELLRKINNKTKLLLIVKGKKNIEKFDGNDFSNEIGNVKDTIYGYIGNNISIYYLKNKTDWVREEATKKIKFLMGKKVYKKYETKDTQKSRIQDSACFRYIDVINEKKIRVFGYLTQINNNLLLEVPGQGTSGFRFIISKGEIYKKLEELVPHNVRILSNYMNSRKERFCKTKKMCVNFLKYRFNFDRYFYWTNITRITPVMVSLTGKFKYLFTGRDKGIKEIKYEKYLSRLKVSKKSLHHKYTPAGFIIYPDSFNIELTKKDKLNLDKKKKDLIDFLCSKMHINKNEFTPAIYNITMLRIRHYLKQVSKISPYLKKNNYYYTPFKQRLEHLHGYKIKLMQNKNSDYRTAYRVTLYTCRSKNKYGQWPYI